MVAFKKELEDIKNTYNITLDRIWNADQTGLYYQKLPNRIYCHKSERSTIRGVKAMKDKNRLTAMITTSANGEKIPNWFG